MSSIKSFENFIKVQDVRINDAPATQWEKRYDDGQTARICVHRSATRNLVCSAFLAQENGEACSMFTKTDAKYLGYAH